MYDVRRKCDKAKDKDGPVSPAGSSARPSSWTQADSIALLQGNGMDGDIP
jgi:hypothetical protein